MRIRVLGLTLTAALAVVPATASAGDSTPYKKYGTLTKQYKVPPTPPGYTAFGQLHFLYDGTFPKLGKNEGIAWIAIYNGDKDDGHCANYSITGGKQHKNPEMPPMRPFTSSPTESSPDHWCHGTWHGLGEVLKTEKNGQSRVVLFFARFKFTITKG